jgi:hypothetical protein
MKKSIDLLRRELHAFCELAQRRGWKIRSGQYVNADNRTCCPLGAARVVTGNVFAHRTILGPGWEWHVHEFWHGFDGHNDMPGQLADLGREFRSVYCKESP